MIPMPQRPISRTSLAGIALAALALFPGAAPPQSDPRLAGYRTPPGWKVEIAAAEPMVVNPVTMTFGPDGKLYVVEWQAGRGANDHIKVLSDDDGDGAFDSSRIYMDGLELPAGVLFWDGWTYVTLDHDVVRLKDTDGDGRFETREVVASGFGNDDSHHRVSGMTLGPDGWLYLTTGDSDARLRGADGSTATVLRSGGVFRCKPDGSRLENVAFGMRNPWGNIAFDDEFHIVHTDNDNEGTPDFTGCRLLHVVEGGDYGWRLREGARCCQPDPERATWNGGRPGRLGSMAQTGRGAPAGLCVLNSAALPPSTRNLLVYPDVFRKLVRAYTLKPVGATYTVAEEFELLASDEGLFRPTDAEIGPDGALYILDWRTDSGGAGQLSGNGQTGRIYRMTWSGTDDEPARPTLPRDRLVRLHEKDEGVLIDALSSEDYTQRRAASLELIRRGAPDLDRLLGLVADRKAPVTARRHALAIASAVDPKRAVVAWNEAIRGPDPSLKRLALELATRFATPGHRPDVTPLFEWVTDDASLLDFAHREPQTLRALTLLCPVLMGGQKDRPPAIRPSREDIGRILDALGNEKEKVMGVTLALFLASENLDADPVLRDAFTRALERMDLDVRELLAEFATLDDPKYREAALFVLQGWRGDDGVATLMKLATGKEEIPAPARVGLFRALRELIDSVPTDRIAEWLERQPKADPSARVEAIHILTAMNQRAILAAGPILPRLMADEDAGVRRAALALAVEVRSKEAKEALVAIVRAPDRPDDERLLALSALRPYRDKALAPTFADLFASARDPGLKAELLRSLTPLDFAAAAERAEGLLADPDASLRHAAIALLGQRPKTARIVVERYNAGKLPKDDLSRVIVAVRPHATPELKEALQGLLKKTVVGADAKELFSYINRWGDTARGRALYLDAKKGGCAVCHRMEGVGGSVGPDLTRVYETLSFEKRLESIVEPSKEIKEGFGAFKVATADGRVVTGLLLSDTAEGVALKDPEGREVRIPAKEIEEKGGDKTSLMPEGIVGQLSFAELADLLAFLGDRKAQETLRDGAGPPGK